MQCLHLLNDKEMVAEYNTDIYFFIFHEVLFSVSYNKVKTFPTHEYSC